MGYRIGVDIGGTFTDFCALEEDTGAIFTMKVFSRPDEPGADISSGIEMLRKRYGIQPDGIRRFTHGTTVGINSIIQRSGIRLCLLTTENFTDVLEIGRLKMPDPYDILSRRPDPLVPREMVLGIRERLTADGQIDTPLDLHSVDKALEEARSLGAEGIVVSLLHSFRNPIHEHAVRDHLRKRAPELPVFCSFDVWPIMREYERTITAVLHGYVQPRVSYYIDALARALTASKVTVEPHLTKSNGGIMTAAAGKAACAQMLLSGTASGVIGAAYVARQCGLGKVMSVDIGGTSADVAIIDAGTPGYGVGEIVGDFPIYIPSVAVTSIGAGGGSIAAVDAFDVLTVGPASAGSTPGPACYGRGGDRPTITDAMAVCGFLGLTDLGYDLVPLDVEASRRAVGEIASRLGRSVEQGAAAIIEVAISGMHLEVSKLMSKRGLDPKEISLLAFGGAGPMLTCFLARELGVAKVVVPPTPGVLAALGGLVADLRNDFIATIYGDLTPDLGAGIANGFADMADKAERWLREDQGFTGGEVIVSYGADMRYRGQSFEISVEIPDYKGEADVAAMAKAFHAKHRELYDYSDEKALIQVVALRLTIVGVVPKPALQAGDLVRREATPRMRARVFLDGAFQEIPVFSREALTHGSHLVSPAVITQSDTTVCIPAGFAVGVDAYSNLVVTQDV